MLSELDCYCTCGACLKVRGQDFETLPAIISGWRKVHSGEGHKPCTPKECSAARRKKLAAL